MVKQPFSAITSRPDGVNAAAVDNATMPELDGNALVDITGRAALPPSLDTMAGPRRGQTNEQPILTATQLAPPASPFSAASAAQQAASSTAQPASPSSSALSSAETAASQREDLLSDTQKISITARSSCWVGSKTDGGAGRQYTVKAGEKVTLTFKKSIELVLGNPDGVSITYNGNPYKPEYNPGERARFSLP
jgi:cytoskeleton protein RodZ